MELLFVCKKKKKEFISAPSEKKNDSLNIVPTSEKKKGCDSVFMLHVPPVEHWLIKCSSIKCLLLCRSGSLEAQTVRGSLIS